MPVSLHTHGWYSLLEGVSGPEALLRHAAAGGHSALALTDTNNLYGAVAFIELAARHGVRPILGACLKHARQRIVALVADATGYRNLCRVISRVQLAAADSPDLVDLLTDHSDGLHLLVDDPILAERLHTPFRLRLWLEVIRPRPHGERHEAALLACGRRLNLRPVASTAAHFTTADEYHTFRIVTAVRQCSLLDRLPATLAVTAEHRLLSVTEMRQRFHDLPEAIAGGEALAALLRADVLPRQLILPRPHLRESLQPVQYLRALCERGLRERDMGGDLSARQRLREELAIIEANDLTGYFLTVRDIALMARQSGHTMALRGSAGNSLVCYLLAITEVNPLRFGLEMARFLHPGRTDLPDIDLDFDWKVRDRIIEQVVERHGAAHVARISAHQFLQPRSAFREAAKVHGLSNQQISELMQHLDERVDAVLLPDPKHGLHVGPVPQSFPLEHERWPRLVTDARRLLGRPAHLTLHPGGIVITPAPVDSYVPVQCPAKHASEPTPTILMTQFEKDAIEYIGLVKIDLLGNRALSTVDEARLHASSPLAIEPANQPDPVVVALLQRGDTLGVTQLESPAMRNLLIQMKPTAVEDVIQALALLRPGAASIGMKECFIRRRHGLEPTQALHPALVRVLGETHGLMLYEDDALRVIQALTGLGAADADRFRKRISKHRTDEEAQALQQEFVRLCRRCGIPPLALDELWAQLAKFNRYSFCKSHAVSYGLIAWQAARLKAHRPHAFWTAALNNNMGAYPRHVYIEAIKRAGIDVRLPCINRSELFFHLEGETICTGLEAIAGLSEELRLQIMEERRKNGVYRDLTDFLRRVSPGTETLATLIRSGAMDFAGKSRPGLLLEARLQRKSSEDLFGLDPAEGWSPPDHSPEQRRWDEWQTLGFVLGPSLFSVLCGTGRALVRQKGVPLVGSHQLADHAGRLVRVQGLVATARNVVTEDGRPLQFVTLEDEHGLSEVTLFAGTCQQVPYLTLGPYVATGVVEERFGAITITARAFEKLANTASGAA